MKTKCLYASLIAMLISGCVVRVGPAPGPVVVAPPPPPPLEFVPEYYVWDGYEYVGEYGGGFYYLGPGGGWIICDRARLERFHGWERGHPDWRRGAFRGRRPPPR